MQKTLDINILLTLEELRKEKSIHFTRWPVDEEMSAGPIPITIHEILSVLPRKKETKVTTRVGTKVTTRVTKWEIFMRVYGKKWRVFYLNLSEEWCGCQEEDELVDALGKLLIWAIKKGWVK